MKTAKAVFKSMITECAAFSSIYDDALYEDSQKSYAHALPYKIKAKVLRELADAIEKDGL